MGTDTERDNVAHTDMTPGLLRQLARELDQLADESAAACQCDGHVARAYLAADLAATYRTRALNYIAATRPGASPQARERLMGALGALEHHVRAEGQHTMRAMFAHVGHVLDALNAYRESERTATW